MKGIIKFHGASNMGDKIPALVGAYNAEWVPTSSKFYFPDKHSVLKPDKKLKQYLSDLQDQCPCKKAKGQWAPGAWRNITAGSCDLDPYVMAADV